MDEKIKAILAKLQENRPDYYTIDIYCEQYRTGNPTVRISLYSAMTGKIDQTFDSFAGLQAYVDALPKRNAILFRDFRGRTNDSVII